MARKLHPKDRQELQTMIGSMFQTLISRSQLRNQIGLMFPVQSGIFQPTCLPSLTGTVMSLGMSSCPHNYQRSIVTMDAFMTRSRTSSRFQILHAEEIAWREVYRRAGNTNTARYS